MFLRRSAQWPIFKTIVMKKSNPSGFFLPERVFRSGLLFGVFGHRQRRWPAAKF
jgi:hypothetical protein